MQLHEDWQSGGWTPPRRHLHFPDFLTALDYVNRLGHVSEEEAHHPDLLLKWGEVRVQIWTHKIDGLTESDFILAAKADQLYTST